MSDSFVTPWTVACQAPLSVGFPRKEAISFSRGSSWTRDGTRVSCLGRRILDHWATRGSPNIRMRDVLMCHSHLALRYMLLSQFYRWGVWGSKRLTDTAGEERSPELNTVTMCPLLTAEEDHCGRSGQVRMLLPNTQEEPSPSSAWNSIKSEPLLQACWHYPGLSPTSVLLSATWNTFFLFHLSFRSTLNAISFKPSLNTPNRNHISCLQIIVLVSLLLL